MAPNPIISLPRRGEPQRLQDENKPAPGLATPIMLTSVVVVLVAATEWARRWALSGCAIESLLIIYGYGYGSRIFPDIPLWTLLASFNLTYAVCSTSWLLYSLFTAACYPLVGITCMMQFDTIANVARKNLRKWLKQLQFTRDMIALFNLPALEIDTDVNGLMVIRGVTISLSKLTIVAHGIELGLKLADEIELAMYCDEVRIQLFRRIEVGEVFGSVKGGKPELFFGDVDDQGDTADDDIPMLGETALLRAATAGSEGLKDRPKLRSSTTGVSWTRDARGMRDSSAKAGFDSIASLSPDDEKADKQYTAMLKDIRTSSLVYQARQQVKLDAKGENGFNLDNEKDMRAAICAELHKQPSIAHPPARSVRVTTLQRISPPHVRRFLHRLPFLLRLLLTTLSYFHLINIKSINVAGSGAFTASMLQEQVFKQYATANGEIRRLERKIKAWLADANFCLQLTDINGLAQVPLSTAFDVVAYLKFNDIMAYRVVPETGTIAQVVRLGGADATATIPSFLIPHHEHVIPPKPTPEDEEELIEGVEEADGLPKTKQAEYELEKTLKDETAITISVHASLPATFDQSLLNFIAALVKATKIIELEKEVDDVEKGVDSGIASPTSDSFPADDDASIKSGGSGKSSNAFKGFARNIRQTLQDGTTGQSIKNLAKELHQNTKDGFKKVVVGGMVNDRWIAKMVGKVATKLQQAQGDLGYSGEICIPLDSYRAGPDLPSKILP